MFNFVLGSPGLEVFDPFLKEMKIIKADTSTKPKCSLLYRIKTCAELGIDEPALAMLGGKIGKPGLRAYGMMHLTIDRDVMQLPIEWLIPVPQHQWIDTGGMLKSYCKHCDATGVWDRDEYGYKEIP